MPRFAIWLDFSFKYCQVNNFCEFRLKWELELKLIAYKYIWLLLVDILFANFPVWGWSTASIRHTENWSCETRSRVGSKNILLSQKLSEWNESWKLHFLLKSLLVSKLIIGYQMAIQRIRVFLADNDWSSAALNLHVFSSHTVPTCASLYGRFPPKNVCH